MLSSGGGACKGARPRQELQAEDRQGQHLGQEPAQLVLGTETGLGSRGCDCWPLDHVSTSPPMRQLLRAAIPDLSRKEDGLWKCFGLLFFSNYLLARSQQDVSCGSFKQSVPHSHQGRMEGTVSRQDSLRIPGCRLHVLNSCDRTEPELSYAVWHVPFMLAHQWHCLVIVG